MRKEEEIRVLFDREVYDINKLDYHASMDIYANIDELKKRKSSLKKSLNGKWNVSYFKNASIEDLKNGIEIMPTKKGTVKVPCCLEFAGFGNPQYVNSQYPFDGHEDVSMGSTDFEYNTYYELSRDFLCIERVDRKKLGSKADEIFDDRDRFVLSFDGIEGAAFIYLNGEFVGYSENAFSPCEFDITDKIKSVNNLLVRIYKKSSGAYLDDQDFWRLSGIFRDVNLYRLPQMHIEDVKVSYTFAENYKSVKFKADVKGWEKFDYLILFPGGGKILSTYEENEGRIEAVISDPKLWSAEIPNLYTLLITPKDDEGKVREVVTLNFGLRDFKLEDGIMKLNGKRIMFKGVDRHEFSGRCGRAIGRKEMEEDIKTMKRLNINAVRTSHYPNNPYFYMLCDKYGMYVIDEANLETHGSWFKPTGEDVDTRIPGDDESWKGAVLDRAKSLYERDKNHPSVLIWSCGNESNGGSVIYSMTKFFKENDNSRLVHYEGIFHDRTYNDTSDMESQMYTKPQDIERYLLNNPKKPFISCEYMHAMGNSLGGMKLYTNLEKYDSYQGGFIWDYIDQNIIKADGTINYGGDFNDRPHDGNFCGDGIIFADRTLSPKAYEVKNLYQNIKFEFKDEGVLIKNENLFVGTSDYKFVYEILENGVIVFVDEFEMAIEPLSEEYKELNTDYEMNLENNEYTIRVKAITNKDNLWSKAGYEVAVGESVKGIFITNKEIPANENESIKIIEGDYNVGIKGDGFEYMFSKQYGFTSLKKNGKEFLKYIPMPVYTRAYTDNDLGARIPFKTSILAAASQNQVINDVSVSKVEDEVTISYTYKLLPDKDAFTNVKYRIGNDGVINVSMHYSGVSGVTYIPEFGLEIPVSKEFGEFKWYGLGPWENYIDRNNGSFLGVYEDNVKNQLTRYARPQECGNRTGTRWIKLFDKDGNTVTFEMDKYDFEFSYLPYSTAMLNEARHIDELNEGRSNTLKVLYKQMGIGGDDSWGAMPHDEFLMDATRDIDWNFKIY